MIVKLVKIQDKVFEKVLNFKAAAFKTKSLKATRFK